VPAEIVLSVYDGVVRPDASGGSAGEPVLAPPLTER